MVFNHENAPSEIFLRLSSVVEIKVPFYLSRPLDLHSTALNREVHLSQVFQVKKSALVLSPDCNRFQGKINYVLKNTVF